MHGALEYGAIPDMDSLDFTKLKDEVSHNYLVDEYKL